MASFPLTFKLKELVKEDRSANYEVVLNALKLVNEEGHWPQHSPPYPEFIKIIASDLDEQIPEALLYADEVVEAGSFKEKLDRVNLYYEIPVPDDMVLNSLNLIRRSISKGKDPILGMFLIDFNH